ncbi:lectin 9-like [Lotus japonicus]|uniref:lectin 9-like n=1 Tax=Lotus japonicus TaxID=34305 RepID=UPI00258BB366|nr:lectin 9-like [Lotus japonicus]
MASLRVQIPLYTLLISIFILQCQSQQYPTHKPETVNFAFSRFEEDNPNVIPFGDASVTGGTLRLTKTSQYGVPLTHSVGRAVHITPVHLWDKSNGALADFTTSFTFVVNRETTSTLHGDGLAFFIAPLHFNFPKNSSGGYLGLFNPENALFPSENEIVAVEFDSFTNAWDPDSPVQVPHFGIDVNSIKSVATELWPIDAEPTNAVAEVSINYNSESKRLGVFLAYSNNRTASVSAFVDLRSVLPEWVRVGFSASTGELVETHDILSWGFEAAL